VNRDSYLNFLEKFKISNKDFIEYGLNDIIFVQTKQSKRVVRGVPSAPCPELGYPHKQQANGIRQRELKKIF